MDVGVAGITRSFSTRLARKSNSKWRVARDVWLAIYREIRRRKRGDQNTQWRAPFDASAAEAGKALNPPRCC